MKLIIQIPCLNEEEALPVTLRDLPREVAGFETAQRHARGDRTRRIAMWEDKSGPTPWASDRNSVSNQSVSD